MRPLSAAAICVLALLVGCALPGRAVAAPKTTPPAAGATAPATMRAVVHSWSRLLNARDNAGVARLFSLPAVVVQGADAYRLRTFTQIALWHSSLPCSGRIVSLSIRGRYVTAVFRLGNRGPIHCDAPGALAAARFEIVRGKIVSWVQVAVPVQDDGSGPVA